MFILLRHYNDYDQHGGYFAGVFFTEDEARDACGGIGRVGVENEWFEIMEVGIGLIYNLDED